MERKKPNIDAELAKIEGDYVDNLADRFKTLVDATHISTHFLSDNPKFDSIIHVTTEGGTYLVDVKSLIPQFIHGMARHMFDELHDIGHGERAKELVEKSNKTYGA